MNDENLNIFKKGNYILMNAAFITDGVIALQQLSKVQLKYNKRDTDTVVNEIRDSIVSKYLGYELINVEKHGFDAKKLKSDEYLEVKQCSASSSSWGATFNDTNLEKAEAFKDTKLTLALAVWNDATDLLFICFGQNFNIGLYLEDRIKNRPDGSRSTQTISFSQLISKYNFNIFIPNSKSKDDVINLISINNKNLNFIDKIRI